MKTVLLNYSRKAVLMMMVGAVALTTSCRMSDEEIAPVPESVENPLTASVYYVTGKVTDQNGDPLSNVVVKSKTESGETNSSGVYTLTISASNVTAVNKDLVDFEFTVPDGYVGQASATAYFPVGSSVGATLTVDQSFSKANTPVSFDNSNEVTVYVDNNNASTDEGDVDTSAAVAITIPTTTSFDASSDPLTVTATTFIPSADATVATETAVNTSEVTIDAADITTPSTAITVEFSSAVDVSGLDDDFEVLSLSFPLETSSIASKALVDSETQYFEYVDVVAYQSGSWVVLSNTTASPNTGSGTYDISVGAGDLKDSTSGLTIGLSPQFKIVAGEVKVANLSNTVIDNLGKTSSLSKDVSYNKYLGLVASNATSGMNATTSGEFKGALETILATTVYSTATTENVTETAVVSGDEKVTISYTQNYRTYTVSADVVSGSSSAVTATYEVTEYGVVNRSVSTETGDLTFNHNF